MKKSITKDFRALAEKMSVGKRPHLYEKEQVGIREYAGPMNMIIPMVMFRFTLHPECTRALYRKQKKEFRRLERIEKNPPSPRKKVFFTSRKGHNNCRPPYRPRPTDAEVTARLKREAYGSANI